MKRLIKAAIALLVVFLVLMFGIGWFFSGIAMSVDHAPNRGITVKDVGTNSVKLTRTHDDVLPGTYAIAWQGGRARVDDIIASDAKTVTRHLTDDDTGPPLNTKVEWDINIYAGDPSAVALDFQNVSVPTPLGAMPAWFVGGTKTTWVILIHGHNATRESALRPMHDLHVQGYPLLNITFRNDLGAPKSKDGKDHLGSTEWHDVDQAVSYAKQNGAQSVVLFGGSMGGSLAMETYRHSSNASMIKALILDSPVISWKSTLDSQGGQNHLPLFETRVAEALFAARVNFDFDDFDNLKHAADFHVPILIYYGDKDTYVPTAPDVQFANKRADITTLVKIPNATHTAGENVNQLTYETQLNAFLSRVG